MAPRQSRHIFGTKIHYWQPVSHITFLGQRPAGRRSIWTINIILNQVLPWQQQPCWQRPGRIPWRIWNCCSHSATPWKSVWLKIICISVFLNIHISLGKHLGQIPWRIWNCCSHSQSSWKSVWLKYYDCHIFWLQLKAVFQNLYMFHWTSIYKDCLQLALTFMPNEWGWHS